MINPVYLLAVGFLPTDQSDLVIPAIIVAQSDSRQFTQQPSDIGAIVGGIIGPVWFSSGVSYPSFHIYYVDEREPFFCQSPLTKDQSVGDF